jgi:hypothetical protein
MKTVRMLLLPLVVVAGSLHAEGILEKEVGQWFVSGAENCENIENPNIFIGVQKNMMEGLTASEMATVFAYKNSNGKRAIDIAKEKDCENCRNYLAELERMEKACDLLSHNGLGDLLLLEIPKKMSQDDFTGEKIRAIMQIAS